MTHYTDEQWLFDLSIPQNGIDSRPTDLCPPEKTLFEHIDGVTECMKRFARETEEIKAR